MLEVGARVRVRVRLRRPRPPLVFGTLDCMEGTAGQFFLFLVSPATVAAVFLLSFPFLPLFFYWVFCTEISGTGGRLFSVLLLALDRRAGAGALGRGTE